MALFRKLLEAKLAGRSFDEALSDQDKALRHYRLYTAHRDRAPLANPVSRRYHNWRASRNLKAASKHVYRVRRAKALSGEE